MRRVSSACPIGWAVVSWLGCLSGLGAVEPVTEVEEVVATCEPPGNGAGPLWCYGAPLLVRQGDLVFASAMETGAGVPPLCNTRWRLYRRDAEGWDLMRHEADFREREPCPLASPGPGKLLLSVNPSTEPPGTAVRAVRPAPAPRRRPAPRSGADRPASRMGGDAALHRPLLPGARRRPRARDVLAMNIDAVTSAQHWSYRPGDGAPSRSGEVRFPIRACYPQVALRDRAAHVLAIGDIVEPTRRGAPTRRRRPARRGTTSSAASSTPTRRTSAARDSPRRSRSTASRRPAGTSGTWTSGSILAGLPMSFT